MTEVVFAEIPTYLWAQALAVVVPCSVVVGIPLVWGWRRVPPGQVRTAIQWAGVILLFVLPLSAAVAWNASTALVLHQRAVVAAWFLVLAAVGGFVLVSQALSGRRARRRPGPPGTTWGMLVFFVAAAALGGIVGADFLGDATHPRTPVEGVLEDVRPSGADTPRPPLVVVVGGEDYHVVGETRAVLLPGMYVRAEALHRTRTLTDVSIAVRVAADAP